MGQSNERLGILGGGQLARMLALEAAPLGIETHILSENHNDPAAQVAGHHHMGPLTSVQAVRDLLDDVRVLTFESEFVDIQLLKTLISKSHYVFPALEVIETIQDRCTQKKLLDQFKIPTSPWREVANPNQLEDAFRALKQIVLKQRRFGYDGYGTFIMKKNPDPTVLEKSRYGFIAEKFVPFKRELACVYVRSRSGEFLTLPLVESVQVNSRCFSVMGPVRHPGESKMQKKFKKLMDSLDYVGTLAVEFFDTSRGLIVNELAPRVHNSAHYTQDALSHSQFEYHLRAGLGYPLPPVKKLAPGFAMINLLGQGGREIKLSRSKVGHVHWYGKTENREGRKLGHINVLGKTPKAALLQAAKWRKEFSL